MIESTPLFTDVLVELLSPDRLTKILIRGTAQASVYIMIASGLSLIFGLMGVLNFAHGSFTMIGMYFGGLTLITIGSEGPGMISGLAVFLVVLAVAFIFLALLGGLLEYTLIRNLYDHPPIYQILLTFGLTLILDGGVGIIVEFQTKFPPDLNVGKPQEHDATAFRDYAPEFLVSNQPIKDILPQFLLNNPFIVDLMVGVVGLGVAFAVLSYTGIGRITQFVAGEDFGDLDIPDDTEAIGVLAAFGVVAALISTVFRMTGNIGAVRLKGIWFLEIIFGLITVVVLWAFLNKTRYGLFVRAGAEDEEMAEALGINVRRVFTIVFAIGSGVAGAAGALLMWDIIWENSVFMALDVLLPAFVIVIIGGLGTFKGTVVASVIVGYVWSFTQEAFIQGAGFAELPNLVIFLMLVLMLIIQPQGLYGVEGAGDH